MTRKETLKIIYNAKETHFASLGRKLSNPTIGLKAYWSILNKIINNKKMTNITSPAGKWNFCQKFPDQSGYIQRSFCTAVLGSCK